MDAKKRTALLGLLFLLSAPAQSFQLSQGHLVFQAGWFYSTQGKSQNIQIEDSDGDRYNVTNRHDNNVVLGLGYLVAGSENNWLRMDYGINAFYLAPASVQGTITQEHLFENLAYRYHTVNVPVYAVAKATFKNCANKYAITVDGGLGPNFNSTSKLTEWTINESDAIPMPDYEGKSNTTFSAMAGVGVKINNVFGKSPLECGYRFFYLGEGAFSKRNDVWINTLESGRGYAQALLCSVVL